MSKFVKLLLIALTLVATVATTSAMAETHKPEAYDNLTASPQRPGKAPRLMNGVSDLSTHERRHQERLPLQLDGAIQKIKKSKYAPKRIQREAKVSKRKAHKAPKARVAKARKAKNDFKVEAMVAPAKRGKSKTHPVGFTENLPMPNSAPSAGPVARDTPDSF